jgi:glutaminyl-tRNA synthetase
MYRVFLERAAEKDLHRLSSEIHDRVITAKVEPGLQAAKFEERYQFERLAYFALDKDSSLAPNASRLIFNRTITLKDAWVKEAKKG